MADGTITSVEELKQHVGRRRASATGTRSPRRRSTSSPRPPATTSGSTSIRERAKNGPFGGTIAHGYWTLSAAPFIMRGGEGVQVRLPSRMGINYGLNRVRFISPVHVGKRIRGRAKLVSVEEVQPNVIQQVSEITVEIEGETKPAMVAESITRTYLERQG